MSSIPNQANIEYHGESWAAALAADCTGAQSSILASALSLLPPTPNASGSWPELWRAWKAAAARGVRVAVWLPVPSPIHPATRGNFGAGRACTENQIEIHYIAGARLLHAKTCIIDARVVWIGSGNFTAAAAHHNHEAYLRADCAKIAHELASRWEALA